MRWIRFEAIKRFHAVYCEAHGLNWTYCGRTYRIGMERESAEEPRGRCTCCQSRMERAYLIPPELLHIRDGALGGAKP